MAFIPATEVLRIGDRIRITEPLELLNGTFTVGHEFTIMSYGGRGFDLQDDDGRWARECGLIQHTFRKVC